MHNVDYAVTRCLYVGLSEVCLSVHLSDATSGSHTILVCPTKWYGNILMGAPLMEALMQGCVKIAIFDQYLALSRK